VSGLQIEELERRLANVIRIGLVESVDHERKKLRVQIGDLLTGWLPWPVEMGRNFKRWRPLRVGTQVVLASPSGELPQAQIIGMLYTTDLSAPSSDPDLDLIEFDNGTTVSNNIQSGLLNVDCVGDVVATSAKNVTVTAAETATLEGSTVMIKSTGSATIQAAAGLTLQASALTIQAPVTQTGGDMTSDGISVQKHTHLGVVPGKAATLVPQ